MQISVSVSPIVIWTSPISLGEFRRGFLLGLKKQAIAPCSLDLTFPEISEDTALTKHQCDSLRQVNFFVLKLID
ncbi:MAG: hypothetical protein KME59_23635 [Trichormus sp. ATA11-4-KO1]|nr:hypothetical protein [Trichormus sp. ATA11-4-KO1]